MKPPSLSLFPIFTIAFVLGMPLAMTTAQDKPADGSAPHRRPVILLTGFEPFGETKQVNSSWEAIKKLNGTKWDEFELVAKQIPVVWGAPQELLSKWILEYRPVAVLSFGQGTPDTFAIESVANNRRGPIRDNLGDLPAEREVISKGPAQFAATADCKRIARSLSSAGFPTSVSKEAGRYLCEETLYSLEYLRSHSKDEMSVLFFHVPPMGSEIGTTVIDGPYLQKFAMQTLDEWRTSAAERKAEFAAAESLIRRYFKVWSDQDMTGYGGCFSKHASIHTINRDGSISLSALRPFVDGQARAHKAATSRMTEVPEDIVLRSEGRLMRAIVYWKLSAEGRITLGYDHFTLCKEGGQWKILNLAFYETD